MITLNQPIIQLPIKVKRPEIELLLCCTRTHIDSETAERIKTLLQQNIDWTLLVEIATYHGTIPLLYQSLNTTVKEAIPKTVLTQLRNRYHTNASRNLFLSHELVKILKLFEANKIPAIPFKGLVLAASVYGNLAMRQFSDLDILVRQQDIVKAQELLIAQKYQLEAEHYGWQQTFVHSQKPEIVVDLHCELTPLSYFPFKLSDFETLWQRRRSLTLKGESIIDLSSNDLSIILAIQVARGVNEGRESLAQICDLAELLRIQKPLDWEQLLQEVNSLELERPFFISLLIVNTLLNTPLPDQIKQIIQQKIQIDPTMLIYAVRMQKQLFTEVKTPLFIKLFFHHLMIKGPLSRMPVRVYLVWQFLSFTAKLVIINVNQKDQEVFPLPSGLSFLYYLIRPIRLVSRYITNSTYR
ncbi:MULTISPECIES: nucleotidyltransferase family protein [unclassified Nostoc]|uniref:nucleotidyltransferase domain-containing protein n=1 Tax=unclassified Nostoc TaxID=2593658 RepID=UPI002AD3BA7B|nr:nucleotidyltransferase family protein [Nostoc sp. DedQUE03]MDZ7976168.1 nucleotidyltransferase family protein [Nostoc sp. DedQUE03]MDZ8047771.1 nucleotidyltransferase family protein [Nostoc sp. DedQUE02]